MEFTTVWFILIAVLWTGYFVLEGFDFGVGMLMPVLGRGKDGEVRKRVLLNTIGPVWDGNEVWVLTAGGATFAAFPHWYATLFSGFYLPLLIILVALIVRALGFDYRGKVDDPTWRKRWDIAIFLGSALPALLWGVALTNVVMGVPINADKEYTGNLFTLLNPVGLLGGLTTVALFLTHGAMYIALKTDGDIRHEARRLSIRVGAVAAVLAVLLLLTINVSTGSAAAIHDAAEPVDTLMVRSRSTASTAATAPTLIDSRRASCRISPSVLRAMYIAPWVRKSATVVSPPSSPTGLRSVNRLPVYSLSALMGRPITTFVSATPQSRAGTAEPRKMATSQRLRQVGSSTLPR